MRGSYTGQFLPIALGIIGGLLVFFLVGLLAKEKQEQINYEWDTTETFVRYENGNTRCFDGMKHKLEDGFVQLYDRERDISIPKSKITSTQTSETACR